MNETILNSLRELMAIYGQQKDGIKQFLSQADEQRKGATAQLESIEAKMQSIENTEGFSMEPNKIKLVEEEATA